MTLFSWSEVFLGRLWGLRDGDAYNISAPYPKMSSAFMSVLLSLNYDTVMTACITVTDIYLSQLIPILTNLLLPIFQMREIFYHDQKGTDAFTGNLKVRKFLNTMTLHPIKVPTLLYRLHNFFLVSADLLSGPVLRVSDRMEGHGIAGTGGSIDITCYCFTLPQIMSVKGINNDGRHINTSLDMF